MAPRKSVPAEICGIKVFWTDVEKISFVSSTESNQDIIMARKYHQMRGPVSCTMYNEILDLQQKINPNEKGLTIREMSKICKATKERFNTQKMKKYTHFYPRTVSMAKVFLEDFQHEVRIVLREDMAFENHHWMLRHPDRYKKKDDTSVQNSPIPSTTRVENEPQTPLAPIIQPPEPSLSNRFENNSTVSANNNNLDLSNNSNNEATNNIDNSNRLNNNVNNENNNFYINNQNIDVTNNQMIPTNKTATIDQFDNEPLSDFYEENFFQDPNNTMSDFEFCFGFE